MAEQAKVLRPEGTYPVRVTDIGKPTISNTGRVWFCRVYVEYPDGEAGVVFVAGQLNMAYMLFKAKEFWKAAKDLRVKVRHNTIADRVFLDCDLLIP